MYSLIFISFVIIYIIILYTTIMLKVCFMLKRFLVLYSLPLFGEKDSLFIVSFDLVVYILNTPNSILRVSSSRRCLWPLNWHVVIILVFISSSLTGLGMDEWSARLTAVRRSQVRISARQPQKWKFVRLNNTLHAGPCMVGDQSRGSESTKKRKKGNNRIAPGGGPSPIHQGKFIDTQNNGKRSEKNPLKS